jgi:hypothetical protein
MTTGHAQLEEGLSRDNGEPLSRNVHAGSIGYPDGGTIDLALAHK